MREQGKTSRDSVTNGGRVGPERVFQPIKLIKNQHEPDLCPGRPDAPRSPLLTCQRHQEPSQTRLQIHVTDDGDDAKTGKPDRAFPKSFGLI